MSKKKKIKRLERENADLRERLKYIEGYFDASNVIIKGFNVEKSTVENITNVFRGGVEINDSKAEM
jgi:predicted nuclease with TOPRIM domain